MPVYSSSANQGDCRRVVAKFQFLTGSQLATTTSPSAAASLLFLDAPKGLALTESTTSRISYTLDSSLDSVNKIEQTAEQVAQRAGLDEDEVFRVSMAVREAAVNAVLHGNAYDPVKKMTAQFEVASGELTIRITDQGKGLDPSTLPDPLAPENILSGSGRGIFLIRSFMDEVHFKILHPGTEITMVKHLASAQTGA